jgi:hypothetical protein
MEIKIKGRTCFSIFFNGCNQSNLSIPVLPGAAKVVFLLNTGKSEKRKKGKLRCELVKGK